MPAHLVIFAKEPVPGRVKTRLAAHLGEIGAARLYAAFVHDMAHRFTADGRFDVTIAASPDPTSAFFKELADATGARLVHQGTGGLGVRMATHLKQRLDAGADRAVLIGTDLPSLPPDRVAEAARLLERRPVVFSPASDGGYYLVGAARAALPMWDDIVSRLFTGISWSTDTVLRDTLSRAGHIPVALGPSWYDVDEPDDLARLIRHLKRPDTPALPAIRTALGGMAAG